MAGKKTLSLMTCNDFVYSTDLFVIDCYNDNHKDISEEHSLKIKEMLLSIYNNVDTLPLHKLTEHNDKLFIENSSGKVCLSFNDLKEVVYTKSEEYISKDVWLYIQEHNLMDKFTGKTMPKLLNNNILQYLDSFDGHILIANPCYPEYELLWRICSGQDKYLRKIILLSKLDEWFAFQLANKDIDVDLNPNDRFIYINFLTGYLLNGYFPLMCMEDTMYPIIREKVLLQSISATSTPFNKRMLEDIRKSGQHPNLAIVRPFDNGII